MINKNWKFYFGAISILCLIIVASGIIYYNTGKIETRSISEVNQVHENIMQELNSEFLSLSNEVSFLHFTPPVRGLARAKMNNDIDTLDGSSTELWRKRLEKIFIGFLQNYDEYFQLRILLNNGDEFLKVVRDKGNIHTIAENMLQNKAHHEYFTEALNSPANTMLFSRISLNKENNTIETPHIPTLRLSIPIYQDEGTLYGVLIANIDVTKVFNSVRGLITEHQQLILMDDEGYYLWHDDNTLKYSRDLAPEHQFSKDYIIENDDNNALYINALSSEQQFRGLVKQLQLTSNGKGNTLQVALMVPQEYINSQKAQALTSSITILSTVVIIALVVLLYFYNLSNRAHRLAKQFESGQRIIDSTNEAVFVLNNQHIITSCNKAASQLTGVPESVLIGKVITHTLQTHLSIDILSMLTEFSACSTISHKTLKATKNSSTLYLQCKVIPLVHRAVKQKTPKIALLLSDVTAENEAYNLIEAQKINLENEVELRTNELQVARDNALKLSSIKSRFISTVSHEMRTPLNGITGAIQLLKRDIHSQDENDYISMAESSIETLNSLVNDILDISKIEAGKLELNPQWHQIHDVLESLISTLSVVVQEKGLAFYIDTSSLDIASARFDAFRLRQIISNLVSNAAKFTKEGHVKITAKSIKADDTATLQLTVEDTGIGISENDVAHLFQEFSQANKTITEEYGGTGLGLSICKQIANIMGGDIHVESQIGKGSTFIVTITLEQYENFEIQVSTRLHGKNFGVSIIDPIEYSIIENLIAHSGGGVTPLNGDLNQLLFTKAIDFLITDEAIFNEHEVVNGIEDALKNSNFTQWLVIDGGRYSIPELNTEITIIESPVLRADFLESVLHERHHAPQETVQSRRKYDKEQLNKKPLSSTEIHALVVDDNRINRKVAQHMLEGMGLIVSTAIHGEDAIEQLQNSDYESPFSIIYMDCNMPILNGYDTTTAIRQGNAGKRYKTIPIMAMTANAMKGEQEKCQAVGMSDYITKPVNVETLEKKTFQLLNNTFELTTR
ncbi:ATP-binding protein [Thalassotalea sp. 1_MG-2023]|uniref:ATP-binding protein n=1 Tax=Thalassotalea sp. 1_MG-2023 TaxID=3062680 RepID=UPI0026E3D837|nr:ATP-binding protein [Thalassotalea sp. 1_MG-2023]MDO6428179.1 ATP-binding protein [Thalassotalea sp. 1_MG-2023]